jgi:hypothetical protein
MYIKKWQIMTKIRSDKIIQNLNFYIYFFFNLRFYVHGNLKIFIIF